jgi:hypothetical protein
VSGQWTFVSALVFGSAVLAFWIAARFPDLGPATLPYAVLHLLAGIAVIGALPVLTVAVVGSPIPASRFVASFCVVLPLFTYVFITGLWVVRVIHRALSGFPH